MTLPLLAVGAVGVIGVATHWCGAEMAEMIAAFTKGDVELARHLNARLIPSFHYETGDLAPNPIPSKVMLNLLGVAVGQAAGVPWVRFRMVSKGSPVTYSLV